MKKTRANVLIVGPGLNQRGGISTITETLYNSKIKDTYNLIVLNTYGKAKSLIFIKGIFQYILYMLKGNIDIIHVNLASKGSFFRKVILIMFTSKKKKILIHLHGGRFFDFYDSSYPIVKKLVRYAFNRADKIIVVSDFYICLIEDKLNINRNKISRIYNGVNVLNEGYENKNQTNFRALFMSTLSKSKGIFDFIDIAQKLSGSGIDFVITGYGDNNLIKNYIEMNAKDANIIFEGWIIGEEKDAVLKSCHVLLAPSYFESFGISIIEAMNYGLAVIGYHYGSIPELIQEDTNGYVVSLGNQEEMIEKLLLLKNNREQVERMGLNNVERSKIYTVEKFIKNFQKIYTEILDEDHDE